MSLGGDGALAAAPPSQAASPVEAGVGGDGAEVGLCALMPGGAGERRCDQQQCERGERCRKEASAVDGHVGAST